MEYLKQEDFDKEFNNGNLCIQFSANWCGPCKTVTASINSIENDFNDIKFFKVNIDEYSQDYLDRFSIRSIPKLVLVKNGTVIDEQTGSKQKTQIIDFLKQI